MSSDKREFGGRMGRERALVCRRSVWAALSVLLLMVVGCESDFSSRPSYDEISFSADTLSFDTVFVGTTSATAHLAVYNSSDDDITLDAISLEGGEASPFGVNIAGVPTTCLENVRMRHSDSLWVFVNIKTSAEAFRKARSVVSDRVVVRSGGNVWTAVLTATVQNVVRRSGALAESEVWEQDSVPYLISDTLLVPQGVSLTLRRNVRLYMGEAATLRVEGALTSEGDYAAPVRILPSRMEAFYTKIPSQWNGISIGTGGTVSLRQTEVACATEAVACDSAAQFEADGLYVRDAGHLGLSFNRTAAKVVNALIVDCGGPAIELLGGDVLVAHSTISNHFSWDYRRCPSLLFYPQPEGETPGRLAVVNSIVMGNLSDEIERDSLVKGNTSFVGCLVRVAKADSIMADTVHFSNCVVAKDAEFVDRENRDYHLTAESGGVAAADSVQSLLYPLDIEGVERSRAVRPQIGAFEMFLKEVGK